MTLREGKRPACCLRQFAGRQLGGRGRPDELDPSPNLVPKWGEYFGRNERIDHLATLEDGTLMAFLSSGRSSPVGLASLRSFLSGHRSVLTLSGAHDRLGLGGGLP